MLVFTTMEDMQTAVQALLECDMIELLRLKDRFGNPTAGGWRDVMINFVIKGDRNKHVCEVQLIMKPFYEHRSSEGHARFVAFRNKQAK